MRKIKIFCLPYAGGCKNIYNDFSDAFGSCFDVCPLEYSGHGTRICDPLLTNYTQCVNDICMQIRRFCTNNYIILGHSLGAAVALGVANKMENDYYNKPKHLILMAETPPCSEVLAKKYKNKNKVEVMETVAERGHVPHEIFENQELYDIFSDIIYSDIRVLNGYSDFSFSKLEVPITVFSGSKDDFSDSDIDQWKHYTNKQFSKFKIIGDHFFPFVNKKDFFKVFKEELADKYAS
jgi:surfactin synthase thioesterase subunit